MSISSVKQPLSTQSRGYFQSKCIRVLTTNHQHSYHNRNCYYCACDVQNDHLTPELFCFWNLSKKGIPFESILANVGYFAALKTRHRLKLKPQLQPKAVALKMILWFLFVTFGICENQTMPKFLELWKNCRIKDYRASIFSSHVGLCLTGFFSQWNICLRFNFRISGGARQP